LKFPTHLIKNLNREFK